MKPSIQVKRSALVEQPLKTSSATGATLACMGLSNAIPLMHGSQGCGAFAKVYLIQHFREPIPLQNTAIDQVAAVMGGDDNLLQAIKLLCEKHQPELIMVMTTGLTEMQGCDLERVIREFRQACPQFANTQVVAVTTPDFSGSMQTGFASAIEACIQQLLVDKSDFIQPKVSLAEQVNVFCSVALTSADIELIERYCEAFSLKPIFVPNLSDSLDGHLADPDFAVSTTGGTRLAQLSGLANSCASIVIGDSMLGASAILEKHFAVPSHFVGMAMGMQETDKLVMLLSQLSGKAVPQWLTRQRQRLQDALLDCHFILSASSCAVALEPDAALGYSQLLSEVGAVLDTCVTTVNLPAIKQLKAKQVVVGDLSDLSERLADYALVVGNTHCANLCEPTTPVLRAGFPCHDRYGNSDILQLGYEGARARLFAIANLLKAHHQDEVAAHYSDYRFEPEACQQSNLN